MLNLPLRIDPRAAPIITRLSKPDARPSIRLCMSLAGIGFVLFLMPLHWLLLSAAAWRALWQLLRDPFRWEKTAHGLARTSRLAAQRRHSATDPAQKYFRNSAAASSGRRLRLNGATNCPFLSIR